MRVCVIHRYPFYDAVSTNPSLPYFVRELEVRGNDVLYLSYKSREPQRAASNVRFDSLPFTLIRKHTLDKYVKSLLFILLTPFIAYKVKKMNIDLIYCDDSLPFYGYLIKKFTRLPVVIRLGDLQTGYLFLNKGAAGKIAFKVSHKLEVNSWAKVDGLITISEPFERYVISKGLDGGKIATVLECVDTEIFKTMKPNLDVKEKYNLSQDSIILMYHGTVESPKGLDTLLKFVSPTLQRNKSVKLFIVGDGSALSNLKTLAKNLGISGSIVWTGWIPFSEMVDYINSCDIGIPMRGDNPANNFVVTSALLQYWACCKPVIAPKLEAVEGIVKDGENGYIFDFGKSNGFEEKLTRLLESEELRTTLGKEGRKTVDEKFRSEVIGRQKEKRKENFRGGGGLGELLKVDTTG